MSKKTKAGWGFDTKDMDTKVRPQDDFFRHAVGNWMKSNTIPHDEARWGTFLILRKETDVKVRAIVAELTKRKRVVKGSPEQLIRDLYLSGLNMSHRNKLGMKPLEPLLEMVREVKSKHDLLDLLNKLHRMGLGTPWGTIVAGDDKHSDVNILHLYQSGLGMPDRDYYLSNKPEQVRVRTAYRAFVEKTLRLLGESEEIITAKTEVIFDVETRLAKASMPKEDLGNPDKLYHKMSIGALTKIAPTIEWRSYFAAIGAGRPSSANVMQPKFIQAVSRLLKVLPLETWKTYMEWQLTIALSSDLTERFVENSFDFYGRTLSGAKEMQPLWRRTLGICNGVLGEALGKLFVEKHFPPEAKRWMDELINNLFTAYRVRLNNLDWMSPATKKRALKKLALMVRKIGYPDRWKSYKGLDIRPDDYFGNLIRASAYEQHRNIKKLKKPVDRKEWHMTPQTVNAYYNPGTNEIAFPAGILQPPYFGPNLDAGVNYGAIGAVIGHEITHGFDNDGSKYDGKGNLRRWWTPEDRRRFERKAKVLKKQFDAYELHGVNVNGKLTLGENIADLGGYAIAFDAYMRHLEKTGKREIIDGLTPEQRFFFGMAQDWKQIQRPESEKTAMLTDPHAPHEFRVNGPASNLPAFYAAFGVKKGDKLYREPKDRAKIW